MKTLGQVGYEALRDTRRVRELYTNRQVFALSGAKEYPETEEWEQQTAEFRSDWEQAANEVAIEFIRTKYK